ncbi:MAG: hemolysin family protein, partial [Proteobacteria bacterium]|nr:hemolysin family protein [Pseudomonadota bacterium]
MSHLTQCFILLGIVGINGFLALSEMALVSSRKTRLQKLADDGHHGATVALSLSESPTRFLASLQICITVLGIAAGAWGGANLSGGVEQWIGISMPSLLPWSHGLGVGFVVAIETFLMVLLGELLPKRIALFFPERIAISVAPFIDRVGIAMSPAAHILGRITDQMIRVLPLRLNAKDEAQVTEDEIKIMVEQGAEAGVFNRTEESMLKRALDFGDLSGAELMTPRTKIVSFHADALVEVVIDRMLTAGFSSYPLYASQRENVVGMVSVKRAFAALRHQRQVKLSDVMIPAVFLPDSAKAGRIFETMRLKRQHIVVLI